MALGHDVSRLMSDSHMRTTMIDAFKLVAAETVTSVLACSAAIAYITIRIIVLQSVQRYAPKPLVEGFALGREANFRSANLST